MHNLSVQYNLKNKNNKFNLFLRRCNICKERGHKMDTCPVRVDETADITGIEHVSICARYVNLENCTLHKDFFQFVATTDLTGKGLATLILDNMKNFGIETQYLRGQGYDGAATMSGKYNGVQFHNP